MQTLPSVGARAEHQVTSRLGPQEVGLFCCDLLDMLNLPQVESNYDSVHITWEAEAGGSKKNDCQSGEMARRALAVLGVDPGF